MTTLIRWTLLLLCTLGPLTSARAADRVLAFQQLDAAAYEDWLVVSYAIPQGVWLALDGRVPVLVVTQVERGEVQSTTTHRVPLRSAAAVVQLPRARATRVGRVTVAVDPASTLPSIGGMSIAGMVGPALELAVTPVRVASAIPPTLPTVVPAVEPDLPPPVAYRPDPSMVLEACTDNVVGGSSVEQCTGRAMTALFDPVPSIHACGDSVTGTTNVLACIEAAVQAPGEPSEVVRACADAVVGSTSVVDCLGRAARHLVVPTDAVRACGASVTGSSHVLDCIDASRDAGVGAAEIIRSCAEAQAGSASVLDCVRRRSSGG